MIQNQSVGQSQSESQNLSPSQKLRTVRYYLRGIVAVASMVFFASCGNKSLNSDSYGSLNQSPIPKRDFTISAVDMAKIEKDIAKSGGQDLPPQKKDTIANTPNSKTEKLAEGSNVGPSNSLRIDPLKYTRKADPSKSSLDPSYGSIRVKLFPVVKPPRFDPYPATIAKTKLRLQSASGFYVYKLDWNNFLKSSDALALNNDQFMVELNQITIDPEERTATLGAGGSTGTGTGTAAGKSISISSIAIVPVSPFDGVQIQTINKAGNVVSDHIYRGQFLFTPGDDEKSLWNLLNLVSLESYLISVVPTELSDIFEPEVAKAQAIAARTFAIRRMYDARRFLNRPWDLTATTIDQAYMGTEKETSMTTRAVMDTRSEILKYRGSAIEAAYHANSGGMTCAAMECFGKTNSATSRYPYLEPVRDPDEVRGFTDAHQVTDLNSSRLTDLAIRMGIKEVVSSHLKVTRVEIIETSRSSRIARISLVTLNPVDNKSNQIELDSLKSIQFLSRLGFHRYFVDPKTAVKPEGANGQAQHLILEGFGLGHGVGLSQRGAQILAQKGKNYRQILNYYYSSAVVISKAEPQLPAVQKN